MDFAENQVRVCAHVMCSLCVCVRVCRARGGEAPIGYNKMCLCSCAARPPLCARPCLRRTGRTRGSRLWHQTLLVAVSVSMVSTACTLSAHSYRTVRGTPMAETACFPLAPLPAPALPPTPALHRMDPPRTDNQVCVFLDVWVVCVVCACVNLCRYLVITCSYADSSLQAIYIYIHVHIHIHICMYMYIYICIYIHVYIHTCTYIYV